MNRNYIIIILTLLFNILGISVSAQETLMDDDMAEKEMQILRCLQRASVDYSAEFDAEQFGIPAPDTLNLKNEYRHEVLALELCPIMPIGVIICISGVDSPSATAYYGHALEFYKLGYAVVMVDVGGHIKINDKKYEEVSDVQAITDYIKSKLEYTNLPIIAMGVAMGGTVAIRSMIASYDINAVISLSAFSSFEDYFAFNRTEAEPIYDLPNGGLDMIADMSEADSITLSKLCRVSGIDHRPVLLMQSRGDKFVPYTYFKQLVKATKMNTNEFESYVAEGNEHYVCGDFLNPASDTRYFYVLQRFLKRLTMHIPTLASRKLEDASAI